MIRPAVTKKYLHLNQKRAAGNGKDWRPLEDRNEAGLSGRG